MWEGTVVSRARIPGGQLPLAKHLSFIQKVFREPLPRAKHCSVTSLGIEQEAAPSEEEETEGTQRLITHSFSSVIYCFHVFGSVT
jgi:hypothetical protein